MFVLKVSYLKHLPGLCNGGSDPGPPTAKAISKIKIYLIRLTNYIRLNSNWFY